MSALEFYNDDFVRTLFPLVTNTFLVNKGEAAIREHWHRCLDATEPSFSFLPQQRVHALKPDGNLRRTVKLDPVAELYLYDLVYRHRSRFRKPFRPDRSHFGYRFEKSKPVSPSLAYRAFRTAIAEFKKKYRFFVSFDVSAYFNSIYHHDLVSWMAELGAPDTDVQGFGQFLREGNRGRSVDCLPQGLYCSKMIGSDFLRFIENSASVDFRRDLTRDFH